MNKRIIGLRIRKIRENLKLNQREFGRLLKLSNASISGYELGDSYPTIDTLVKIADIGKVPISWIVIGDVLPEHLDKLLSKDDIRLLKAFHQATDDDQKVILRVAESIGGPGSVEKKPG